MEKSPIDSDTNFLLIRLDERLKTLNHEMGSIKDEIKQNREENKKQFSEMRAEIKDTDSSIQKKFEDVYDTMEEKYVSVEQFAPIKNIIYSFVGLVLTAVVTALIGLIIKS